MATVSNKSLIFREIPTREMEVGVHMCFEDRPMSLTPPPKGITIKTLNIGFDPHQRDRMRGPDFQGYVPGYVLGETMSGFTVAKVVESDNEEYKVGDIVSGVLPLAEYGVVPVEVLGYKPMASPVVWKVNNKYNLDLNNYIGPLGLAGMTAWNSFYSLVKPEKGQTIWVNAASSSVGELVVQLAKREGMRVIGSVSSAEKLKYVKDLGADEVFNYKEEKAEDALKRLAPDGLDVVYDNVGGEDFEAAIANMKWFGKIISCGMVCIALCYPRRHRECVPLLIPNRSHNTTSCQRRLTT